MAQTDLLFTPIVDALLQCYCQQLQLVSQPVAECGIRPGEQVAFGISFTKDECCTGLGWVRVASWGAGFPAAEEGVTRCSPELWRLVLELGAVRCAPTGSAEVLPTQDEWNAVHALLMEDGVAMRKAIICCFAEQQANRDRLISISEWTPVGPEGMCVGGTLTVTVEVLACDEC